MAACGALMNRRELERWARDASWQMVSECPVPWVASESDYARGRANKWIRAQQIHVATGGWNTYSDHASVTDDDELDLETRRGGQEAQRHPLLTSLRRAGGTLRHDAFGTPPARVRGPAIPAALYKAL